MAKKLFSIFLLIALIAMLIPVVAAQDEMMECPEGDAKVTVAAGSVGAELDQARGTADAYMEMCPNVTVEVIEMPDSSTERLALYLQTWEAQSGDIDVFQVDVIWPAIIAPHVVDFNEYLTEDEIGQYFADMITGQTVDGKLVAIPWFSDAAGLYARTDLLEEYGIEIPTTWDELTVAAEAVQEAHRAVTGNDDFYGYVWQGNDYEGLTCDAHEWLVSETGDSFIRADGTVNVTDPAWIAALERAAGWVGTISPEGVTTYKEEDARNVFQAGNAAFMRNWPYAYNLGNGEDSAVVDMFEWVPLPAGENRVGACLGGWQIAVSKYSNNVDAAVAYAKFMTSADQMKERALSAQGNPPTMPAIYEDPDLMDDPLMSRLGPILGTAYPRPSVATGARYNEASALFSSAVHSVLTGDATATDAMAELEVQLEDLMAEIMGS
ncbi:ABC transporter substrate-binding protein [Anaerolineales bacterium]